MRFAWMVQIALIVLGPPAVYAYVHRKDRAQAAKGAGAIATSMFVGLFSLFVVGETFADPGGWKALGLVAAWAGPMAALTLMAWRWPARSRPVFIALVALMVVVHLWSALAPEAWWSFEDRAGPVRGVLTMALALPLAVLALTYARAAGMLLLLLGLMPFAAALTLMATGRGGLMLSLAVLDVAALVGGTLFLLAARLETSSRNGVAGRGRRASATRPHAIG